MLSEMRQRRVERKKPKRFVALKKVSLDASQHRSISTAQANIVKHPITQMHVGRSSTAFSVAVVFHVLIGFIISVFYIADHIEQERETFNISIVTEDAKTKRRFRRRETPKFQTKEQQQQELLIKRPVKTATSQPLSSDGFVIPDGSEATVDLSEPGSNSGPKMIDVNRKFVQPSRSLEPETKAPSFEIEREAPSLINKLDADITKEGPGLDTVDLEPEPDVIKPKIKYQADKKYPNIAKKAEKEGKVILKATIDEDGIPRDIVALTNLGYGLEEAAIQMLRKCTYRPATKAGKPISLEVEIPVVFSLKDN
jgi:TonB family protein